jgi:hypothetical protein
VLHLGDPHMCACPPLGAGTSPSRGCRCVRGLGPKQRIWHTAHAFAVALLRAHACSTQPSHPGPDTHQGSPPEGTSGTGAGAASAADDGRSATVTPAPPAGA